MPTSALPLIARGRHNARFVPLPRAPIGDFPKLVHLAVDREHMIQYRAHVGRSSEMPH
jgi:hypothetical protein